MSHKASRGEEIMPRKPLPPFDSDEYWELVYLEYEKWRDGYYDDEDK